MPNLVEILAAAFIPILLSVANMREASMIVGLTARAGCLMPGEPAMPVPESAMREQR